MGEDSKPITLVDPSNPVAWKELGKTLVGSLIALVYAGVFGALNSVTTAVAGIWRGLGSFGGDVFDAIGRQGDSIISSAADATAGGLNELPFGLGWIGGVAIVMLGLYIVALGIRVIRDG